MLAKQPEDSRKIVRLVAADKEGELRVVEVVTQRFRLKTYK
jgi:ribulose bisphosphate carboxylase small subunit